MRGRFRAALGDSCVSRRAAVSSRALSRNHCASSLRSRPSGASCRSRLDTARIDSAALRHFVSRVRSRLVLAQGFHFLASRAASERSLSSSCGESNGSGFSSLPLGKEAGISGASMEWRMSPAKSFIMSKVCQFFSSQSRVHWLLLRTEKLITEKLFSSPVAGRLQLEHFRIPSAPGDEVIVVALLGDLAVLENQNAVGHPDGRKAVRNQDGHLAGGQLGEALEDGVLGARVERGGRLVQDQQS